MRKGKTLILPAIVPAALLIVCSLAATWARAARQQSSSQQQTSAGATPGSQSATGNATPAVNPADVASIDAIMRAAYDTISGPAGHQRDWNRFRSLFIEGARLAAVVPDHKGGFRIVVFSPDEYIKQGDPYFQKNGFFEHEVARRSEKWADIAQVFSTYESRHAPSDAKPFERGINSFQLMNDGHRWWIVTIYWQGETSDTPIPKEYLEGVN